MEYPHILTGKELAFISEHLNDDPQRLYLKYHGQPEKRYLISQIAGRQKLRGKIPEWIKYEQIQFPDGLPLEQASSEATAKLKASLIQGQQLADLTGGLGIDCYYLSFSFAETRYVERSEELVRFAGHNFSILGRGIMVHQGEAQSFLADCRADVIYLDPHRRGDDGRRQFQLEEHEPDVLKLLPQLTIDGRRSLIKTSPMLDITKAVRELKKVSEIWVISVKNECREVLYLLSAEASNTPSIKCFNLHKGRWQTFSARHNRQAVPETGKPLQYIYEPNASIMKAGLQDQLALDLGLNKLHPNSQLFTADNLLEHFPGKIFKMVKIHKPWAKELKKESFNVISRNFPEKASTIERRLKIKPGGAHYLLATRLADDGMAFIHARQLTPE